MNDLQIGIIISVYFLGFVIYVTGLVYMLKKEPEQFLFGFNQAPPKIQLLTFMVLSSIWFVWLLMYFFEVTFNLINNKK